MEPDIIRNFDLTSVEMGHRYRIWQKTILGENSFDPKTKFLLQVLKDAEQGKRVEVRGGRLYYSCARFIKKYHNTYTFTKTPLEIITCCNAYPRICGGECCSSTGYDLMDNCGCNKLPTKAKHIDNCYNDCCQIIKIRHNRKFVLTWHNKHELINGADN